MIINGEPASLAGRHFLVNIAIPENHPSGIVLLNRDPRKQRKKPDAYVGSVEEVAPGCLLVKPGDKIVFQRWEWGQYNVDDERLIADETDLIMLDDTTPAPGIIVVDPVRPKAKVDIVLPSSVGEPKTAALKGRVLAFSKYRLGELAGEIGIGDILYFQKSDTYQWRYSDGRMAIKVCNYFEIMAIEKAAPQDQAV